jgi:hypothetical protein
MARISGTDGNPPAQAREVADMLYGRSVARDRNLSVNLADRIKSQFGESSPEWTAVRQGLFRQLVEPGEGIKDFGPGTVATRINKFLNVDGKELASRMYSPDERAAIQAYADLNRQLEVPQTGANWSNTSVFNRSGRWLGTRVGMAVGAMLGRAVMPWAPWLLSEAVGAAAAKGAAKLADRSAARVVAKQLPLVADQMQAWQKAVARANKANAPMSNAAVQAAKLNLTRALRPLGIDFNSAAAAQDQGQQNNLGTNQPSSTQTNQGGRAHGGKVSDSRRLPKGARLARDGRHYVPDSSRPGKYLLVIHHGAGR